MTHFRVIVLICFCSYFVCRWSSVGVVDAANGYKGIYGKVPAHYEVVVPRKISDNGDFISHTIPHHYKRSYYTNRRKRDMNSYDVINYLVPIAGVQHHLELTPNNDIFSPAMVIEIHDDDYDVSKSKIRKVRDTQCYYSGKVRGMKDSWAAISTCYGLTGYIRTKRGYYIIEPAAGHNPLSGKQHPHLVYRDVEEDDGRREINCETTGDIASIMAKRSIKERGEENGTSEYKSESENIPELHIESMLVLDHALLQYHNQVDVESYVLTVFNMAHNLFHDSSLGTNINLAIVRLIRLQKKDNELNLSVNKDVNKTLEYFRMWQNRMNPGDDTHPNHHDVAVLLTRIDICGDKNCGLLGASRLSGICDKENQAAICEDNGLRLGFIIAHEIGHTLGIVHDTPPECGCDGNLPNGLTTVMNPEIKIQTSEWSNCSSRYLKLFIDSGFGKCLYDPPIDHSFTLVDILPGVMYGGDFQCRTLIGPNAALCDTGMDCSNLICYLEDVGCIETHTSAAPGTPCGEKRWCYRGQCIDVGTRPGAVDGKWGKWSEWSQCSRTCGSGVAWQVRHCNNPPPAHGGKYCAGGHRRHRICSTEPCDVGQPSFRDVQCAEFNEWVYPEDNKVHTWSSYRMAEENPCVLLCVNDEGSVASLRPRVIDGTTCLHGIRDICIDGLCREIPCDLDLESKAVEDACGVCHGDGSSCKIISGQQFFAACTDEESGKHKFLDIPAQSVNIKVEEMEPSQSMIQVRSKDSTTIFIKGNALGMYNVPGSKAWLGMIRTKQEALNIPGPIAEQITIWVISRENVTIKYSYGIKETAKRTPYFEWDFVDWSRCSAQCGPGTQVSLPRCMEKTSGMVDDAYCKDNPRPKEQIRPCEIAPCIPRWMIGDWQKCDKCPKGKHVRVVKCIRPTGEGEGEAVVIEDAECAGPKPKEKESCTCLTNAIKRSDDEATCDDDSSSDMDKLETQMENSGKSGCINNTRTEQMKTIIDKESPQGLKLTIHIETNDGKWPKGIPKPKDNSTSVSLCGKEATEFLNKMQKDFRNNKTKV